MTNPRNIIELVKELQERNDKAHGQWLVVEDRDIQNSRIHQFHIDADDGSDEEVTSPIGFYYENDLRMMCELRNAFPAIAESLLICVEALEKARYQMDFAPRGQDKRKAYQVIVEALQKIYSLPL